MSNSDLLIYKKYTELYYYAYNLLEKYPKAERFGLVSDIKNSMNTTLKYILYAQKVGKEYKVGCVVSVRKDDLRKALEAAGIVRGLSSGF